MRNSIEELVFDLGNVVVEFKPKAYMKRLGFSEEDIDALFIIIFKDKRWNDFDRGTLSIEEYTSALVSEHPEYKAHIEHMFSGNWTANLFKPKEETIQFLKEAATKGYRIYVLSNVSEHVLNYVKTLGFWDYVTGGTYSYVHHYLKPEPEIYEVFFRDNDLIPEKCLFLDDLPQNIAAAKEFGMNGIVFCDNLEEVSKVLSSN